MNVYEIAAKAADHIEKVGLNQDGSYYPRGIATRLRDLKASQEVALEEVRDKPCCVLGAVGVVTETVPVGFAPFLSTDWFEFHDKFATWLRERTMHDSITWWSDDTPQADVVFALRSFAAEGDK